jgi:hypothetical protein
MSKVASELGEAAIQVLEAVADIAGDHESSLTR